MKLMDALNAPAAIVGTTGAGKTFAAKGAVEELLTLGRRVVVIDPTGAWWGLRSGAGGDAAGGFPVTIFGGDHADIPINDTAGARLAEAIAGREVQAIIDVSEMTGGEKTRFLTDFLQTLYAKNKAALHLVVDEADEVCPQNPMPEERRLSGAFDKIVRRGRIKGFRPLMITQRPAVLHKNVLSQIGTLIALKLTSPQDRKAIDDWVKGNADTGEAAKVMKSLPTLPRGEGWLWSPAAGVLERRSFPKIRTFDSSRTPGADEAVVDPPLSSVDVEALRAAMDVQPAPSTPKGSKASAADIAAAEERGYQRGLVEGIERGKAVGASAMLATVRSTIAHLRIPDVFEAAVDQPKAPAPVSPVTASRKAVQRAPSLQRDASSPLTDGERRLLDAVSTPEAVGWSAAAIRAGYAPSGGGFLRARKSLLERGIVTEAAGKVVAPAHDADVPSAQALIDLWSAKLDGGAGNIVRIIAAAPWEAGMAVNDIAAAANYVASGGGFLRAMKALRNSGIVERQGKDVYRLSQAFIEAAARHGGGGRG